MSLSSTLDFLTETAKLLSEGCLLPDIPERKADFLRGRAYQITQLKEKLTHVQDQLSTDE